MDSDPTEMPATPESFEPAAPDVPADGTSAASAPPRSRGGALAAAALVLCGAAGGAVLAHTAWRSNPAATTSPAPSTSNGFPEGGSGLPPGLGSSRPTGTDSTGTGPSDAAAIAQNVNPGVVDINTTLGYESARAAGTGMVLTSTGEVLTNNHVIDGATSISVTDIGNGKTYAATVVGYDKTADVAVLQLTGATGLQTITPATTAASVGAGVVGVGNAGGSGGTPTYAGGVITAVDKTITAHDEGDGSSEQLNGLLETDAAIVAGDSGGPLVNAAGDVVGMDTAASASYRFSGTSQAYAIPIATVLQIAHQIKSGASSATVHVGPTALLGVGVTADATVADVVSGGPADDAGITVGDRIVSVAGQRVGTSAALSRIMIAASPTAAVPVAYVDTSGQRRTVTVQLTAGPPQ